MDLTWWTWASDLAKWSPSGASTFAKTWTCSEQALDSQWCTQPFRVRGHRAARPAGQVECCTAAPLVAFPTPPYPTTIGRWHAISATLSSQWLVWGLGGWVWRACPQPFSLRTSSTSLPLALSDSLFPKLLLSYLGSWTQFLPPDILPAESNKKSSWSQWGVHLFHSLPSTMPYRDKPGKFCQLHFILLSGHLAISASSVA